MNGSLPPQLIDERVTLSFESLARHAVTSQARLHHVRDVLIAHELALHLAADHLYR
ncbi:hypothetical protein R5W24_000338 [Gemmata sp. JC717]|uniref:hypothetical protein n=1 Tax=Gemmata algarum TaxID=2975278 RepID=UPI0021BB111D|nr:hypothetical protein [Gemmata algarum]MDY3551263.1 hypothetical protein [Gemmata algarum]